MSCNLQNPPEGVEILPATQGPFDEFDEEQLKVVRFAAVEGQAIRMASKDVPNSVTAFWFREQLRLDDGFRARFKVKASSGTADGFAFVVQDDRDEDTLGSAGAALGFDDVFPRYLAIGFDFCSDRPDCNSQSVRVDAKFDGESPQKIASFSESLLFGDAETEELELDVRIDYLADEEAVEVFVNEESLLFANVSLAEILLNKFAHYGVTAANADSSFTAVSALDLVVSDFSLDQYLSGFKLRPEAFIIQQVDFGQVVSFQFDIVDFCNEPLESADILNEEVVSAFLQDIEQEPNRIAFSQIQQVGSAVTLFFVTAQDVIATYTLEVEVLGVRVQDSPVGNIVQASAPEAAGVSLVGAVLLGCLSLIVFLLILFASRGYWKYKTKLDDHEEDIEYGKTKETLDKIDSTIHYHMNPLVAPLDKLKERLERNKRFIEEIKEGQRNAEDSDYTVEQLQEENEQLRIQIADVKRQKEFAEAAFDTTMDRDDDFVFIPPPKASFDDNFATLKADDESESENEFAPPPEEQS